MNQNLLNYFTTLATLVFLATIALIQDATWGNDAVNLIPLPRNMVTKAGHCKLTAETQIFFATREASRAMETTLRPLAEVLSEDIELLTGIRPLVSQLSAGTPGAGDLVLNFQPIEQGLAPNEAGEDQAYRLEINDSIQISSQYYKGVAYGTASLLQLIEYSKEGSSLPRLSIRDQPATSYRTVMLDIARQPHSLACLRETIDLCRLYKIRYLQLHLTDDQSFTYPFEPVISGLAKNKVKNNSYTREELIELVAYADARGVTLVPELDLPGHSTKLRQSGYLIDDPEIQGFGDADVASPINQEKIQAIIKDMVELFGSSPYFHIGGDESAAGSRLEPFLGHTNQFLRGLPHPKRMLVWEGFRGAPLDELPATGHDRVIVLSWEGGACNAPWSLLKNGYTIVNASWKPLYIVGGGSERLTHYSMRRWPAKTIYQWDSGTFMHWQPRVPVYEDQGPEDPDRGDSTWKASYIGRENQVLGGQLLFWEQNESIVFPELQERIPAFASRLWNPGANLRFEDFRSRQVKLQERLAALIRPVEILPETIDPASPVSADYRIYQGESITLRLRNRSKIDGLIRYELDGVRRQLGNFKPNNVKRVSTGSQVYHEPTTVVQDGLVIRAGLFDEQGQPVRGQSYQIYNNFPHTVVYTNYQRDRDEFPASKREFPDFEDFIGQRKVIESATTPWLRGSWRHTERALQRLDTVWRVSKGGTYKFESKADSGRATTFIDLNQNGRWEANEKLISTLPKEKYSSVDLELEPGDYRLRIDHITELVRPVLTTAITGPDTGDRRQGISAYLVPLDEHGLELGPRH